MSIRRKCRKAAFWGCLLVLTVLVGGVIAAYQYATDSETIAEAIRRESPRFFPGCRVDVYKAKIKPFVGELTLSNLRAREVGPDLGPLVGQAARIMVKFDPWGMFKGRFEAREVLINKPLIRLRRRPDGSWNLQGLVADPWPGPLGMATPPISVQDGTVELSEDASGAVLTLLHDVAITFPASEAGTPISFDLTAKGDFVDRVHVAGTFDPLTGRAEITAGDVARLNLSATIRDRLPARFRDALKEAGLAGGEVDANLASLNFDPEATPSLRYAGSARLRYGTWKCDKLPFPINDISADVEVRDGRLAVTRASGIDGATSFRLKGRITLDDPVGGPFECRLEAKNLPLDERLRRFTPGEHKEIWDLYFPEVGKSPSIAAGWVNAVVEASRPKAGAEIAAVVDVTDMDVSVKYRHFPYKVDHVRGQLHATPKRLTLAMNATIGRGPLLVSGTVDNPGPDAVANLDFEAESLPIDDALFQAMPPDVRKVVSDFDPSGLVRGKAHLLREPPRKPGDDPIGVVKLDAIADLIPGTCEVTWKEMKYPVRNLTGTLEIHPDDWTFTGMRGNNGQAVITGGGRVRQIRKNQFKVALDLKAENLPFSEELQKALPAQWQKPWETLNPSGACDMEATIDVDPDRRPKTDHNRVVIFPRKRTSVKLVVIREPRPGIDPGATVELRMDDVTGRFVMDTTKEPPTEMTDVGFNFHGSPVSLTYGQVDVEDSGAFRLGLTGLEVANLRLDEGLRQKMPPEMANSSRRLDDVRIPKIRTNLGLGWSGKPGDSAWCRWEDALVILSDNRVEVGGDLGLEHIQGQLEGLHGLFDGQSLEVHGKLNLDSVNVLDQQLTGLKADFDLEKGRASLDRITGSLLGGSLQGQLHSTLEATPRYSVALSVDKLDLRDYARNLRGHQSFKGLVTGSIEVQGLGYDPHAINGRGEARVDQGDLGELPVVLRFINVLKLAKETKTAFDSAKVDFLIKNGETTLDPLRFSGNAFSLDGKGTLDVRGELDLKLRILAGRDNLHLPILSDFSREFSGQFLVVRVQGPASAPTFKPQAIPLTSELFRRREERPARRELLLPSFRTYKESRIKAGVASTPRGPVE
ncbi:AsmA-like C-terminal region-containing protein [Tundrisphaera lichenicola]|uniref:AsmA family protein n=1 Tax=Tundrisphaera lichenicola TaxID=2029860 RepID=UPI003EBF3359